MKHNRGPQPLWDLRGFELTSAVRQSVGHSSSTSIERRRDRSDQNRNLMRLNGTDGTQKRFGAPEKSLSAQQWFFHGFCRKFRPLPVIGSGQKLAPNRQRPNFNRKEVGQMRSDADRHSACAVALPVMSKRRSLYG